MLVTLEGIDGAGKSTLYEALRVRLADMHPVFTREPGSELVGPAVRRALAGDGDPLVEAALFVADHAVHLATVVKPALERGELVVSDRYVDSRFAYQEESLAQCHANPKGWLSAVHAGWSVVPDVTFLLLISPRTAVARLSMRGGEAEHFEREEFLEGVQRRYLERVQESPGRFVLVDAEQSPETVAGFVERSIRERM
ncbi:MAG: dTMP kinase [Methanocorpusculum sp.]|nr:dTMP kinase [Methanocorpusculum sp.]